LTKVRPIAGLPFAGRYRVIDFILSNMVNNGITNIGIFTQNKFRSLMDHIGSGKSWDLDRKIEGIKIFNPEYNYNSIVQRFGDIQHFYKNLDFLKRSKEDYIFISRSYMVCNINLSKAFKAHLESDGDITVIYKNVKNDERYLDLDRLNITKDGFLDKVGKNTGKADKFNLSMEMYIMRKKILIQLIENAIENGDAHFLKQALFNQLNNYKVNTFAFDKYLACINTSKNFYKANLDMLNPKIYSELFNEKQDILTKVKDEPSTMYYEDANVKNSLVANGCKIKGNVKNSIIFRNVKIEKGVNIENSIVMQNTTISNNSNLTHVISDKAVSISEYKTLSGDKNNPYIIPKLETL
ncbi:MAG: glucose-1-phosphate adenylyltransferase subunit GlgD, partial [Bacillota bacterium]